MALIRKMGTLVSLCAKRSDKVGDPHFAADECKELVSELYGELHGAVSEVGSRYFETEADIAANGAASYALPTDHLSTIGVDFVYDAAGHRRPVYELMVQEHSMFSGRTGDAYLFALTGVNLALYPQPANGTYKHLYVPQPADLTVAADATDVDLINNDGLSFVVWGVASIALHKSSQDQMRSIDERDKAKDRLVTWAVGRALTMPKRRVVTHIDLQRGEFWNPAVAGWWNRP